MRHTHTTLVRTAYEIHSHCTVWATSSFFDYLGLHQTFLSSRWYGSHDTEETPRNKLGKEKIKMFPLGNIFRAFLALISLHASIQAQACMSAPLSVSSALLPRLLQDQHLAFAAFCRWVVSDMHTTQLSVSGIQVIICLLINQQLH